MVCTVLGTQVFHRISALHRAGVVRAILRVLGRVVRAQTHMQSVPRDHGAPPRTICDADTQPRINQCAVANLRPERR